MSTKAVVVNRLSGPISDTASRKLDRTASVLPILHAVRGELDASGQREGNVINIPDAVSEICEPFSSLPTKQHALRVESDALVMGHAGEGA